MNYHSGKHSLVGSVKDGGQRRYVPPDHPYINFMTFSWPGAQYTRTNNSPNCPASMLARRVYGLASSILAPFVLLGERVIYNLSSEERRQRQGAVTSTLALPADRTRTRLLWLHGSSLGETAGAITIVRSLSSSLVSSTHGPTAVLITASSVPAARHLGSRIPTLCKELPHLSLASQLLPLDTPRGARAFLSSLRPAAALLVEGDVWPHHILRAKKCGVPVAIIDAKISDRSARRWARYAPGLAHETYSSMTSIYSQTTEDDDRLSRLGAPPSGHIAPSLKFATRPLVEPHTHEQLTPALESSIQQRSVWIAVSTHAGEESLPG
jgi:3-deoxy-D-manno-octulosonic-acid transferase